MVGQIVIGIQVNCLVKIIGNEVSICCFIIGMEYLGVEVFQIFCQMVLVFIIFVKVCVIVISYGNCVIGNEVGCFEKVIGDEFGICKSVIGIEYILVNQFVVYCGGGMIFFCKVGYSFIEQGCFVSGVMVGCFVSVIGDEVGVNCSFIGD